MREQKSFYTAAAFHRHPACFWRTRSQPAVGQDSQDSMHFSHGFFWQPCEKLYFSQRQKFNYFRFSDLFEVRIGKKTMVGHLNTPRTRTILMANIPLSVGCRSVHKWIDFAGKGLRTWKIYPKKRGNFSNKIKPNKHFVHFYQAK